MKPTFAVSAATAAAMLVVSCVRNDPTRPPPPPPPVQNIVLYDAWWEPSYATDYDADGYTSYRRLFFDVDARDGGTYTVYATIEYASSSSSVWRPYLTTNAFTIRSTDSADAYWVAVGKPNTELPRNIYDFRICVYDASTHELLAVKDEATDVDLNDQRFETDAQDPTEVYIEVYIFETYWYDTLDYDNDGYFRYGKLAVDIDATDGVGTYWVSVHLYYRPTGASSYSLYYQTDFYRIVGDNADDVIWVGVGAPNTELPRGAYDFYVEVYRSGTPTLQDWYEPGDDPAALEQWFVEPAAND